MEGESKRGPFGATTTAAGRSAAPRCVCACARQAPVWLVAVRCRDAGRWCRRVMEGERVAVVWFSAEAGVSAGVGEPPVMLPGLGVAVAVLQEAALEELA
jgi:hypothetical protein